MNLRFLIAMGVYSSIVTGQFGSGSSAGPNDLSRGAGGERDTPAAHVTTNENQIATGEDQAVVDTERIPRIQPLQPSDALKTFRTRDGLRMELIAHEPLVTDPV